MKKKATTKTTKTSAATEKANRDLRTRYQQYVSDCNAEHVAVLSRADWERDGAPTRDQVRARYDTNSSKSKTTKSAATRATKTAGGDESSKVRLEDAEVTGFVEKQLAKDKKGSVGVTSLLKALRTAGKSCEQGRFRNLAQPLVEKHRKAVSK